MPEENMQKPEITYADFEKNDIRIGLIAKATAPDWSRKLIEFTVDFGPEIGTKTIFSGIKEWFEPEYFVGKHGVFIINLAERKMGEGVSQGMMLMADGEEPVPFFVPNSVAPGTIVR